MGLKIYARDPEGPIPRHCVLELTCDVDGLFPAPPAIFDTGSYVTDRAMAEGLGWKITGDRVLCPEHSGKKRRED